jgi:FSR family fosmidomycin resistance protein-like MFS transporter
LSLIKDRGFQALAAAHLGVDLINSQKTVLLAFLSVPLGLSNSMVGLVNTLYGLMSSVAQPVFGGLADRFGTRWGVGGGVAWLAGFFSAAMLTHGTLSLALLVIAAAGSAAFHPAGVMEATLSGRAAGASLETTATSFFFLFGQTGLSAGPAIGGLLLDHWGPPGLLLILLFALPAGGYAATRVSGGSLPVRAGTQEPPPKVVRPAVWIMAAFGALAVIRMWVQFNFAVYLPKYYADLGYDPARYGLITGLFMAGVALANVTGGWLGDRHRRWPLVVGSLILSVTPIGLFPWYGPTGWTYILTPLAGALIGASHSLVIVHAQKLMPSRMGTASGMALGLTFAAGSLGSLASGVQADHLGFAAMFLTTAALALLGGVLGLSMRAQPQRQPTDSLA